MSLLPGSILTATALVVCGCVSQPPVTPVYDATTHQLVRLDYDYDADGQVDVRTYMKQGQAVRFEGDTNKDGLIDRWEYYDAAGALERLGGSSQGDGVEDTWLYRSGSDVRIEISTRGNRTVDRREYYRENVLVRTDSDTN